MKIDENIFNEDVKNCSLERQHLVDFDISDPGLKEIDELFADADAISRKNDVVTNRQRLIIAVCGVLVTLFFMNYGEGKSNLLLSSSCFILIIVVYLILKFYNNRNRHMKHLQYRVLAESLRAQFFLSYVGIDEKVVDMLPYVIEHDIPLIKEKLSGLPETNSHDVKYCWKFCQNESKYHKDSKKDYDGTFRIIYNYFIRMALTVTILSYFAAFIFDLYLVVASPVGIDLNRVYFYIKLVMGVMTMVTLLMDGLFGKMSLDTKVEYHDRMMDLYEKRSPKILYNITNNEEKAKELFIELIREFLFETSAKYVYQKQNQLEFVLI